MPYLFRTARRKRVGGERAALTANPVAAGPCFVSNVAVGHRCNYVVRENAEVRTYYSQSGALSLPREALSGPAAFLEMVRQARSDGLLADDVFSEGDAFVDVDARELWIQTGLVIRLMRPVREAYTRGLAAAWPEWRVFWCDGGIVDIASHLGWERPDLRKSKALAPPNEAALLDTRSGAFSWVTVVNDGAIRDWPFQPEPAELLLIGPELLQVCERKTPEGLPREDHLGGGLLLEPRIRRVGWWSCGNYRPTADQIARAWRGWQVEELKGGLPAQVGRSGRDSQPFALTDHEVARYLEMDLFPTKGAPPTSTFDLVAQRLAESGVRIDPRAFLASIPPA